MSDLQEGLSQPTMVVLTQGLGVSDAKMRRALKKAGTSSRAKSSSDGGENSVIHGGEENGSTLRSEGAVQDMVSGGGG